MSKHTKKEETNKNLMNWMLALSVNIIIAVIIMRLTDFAYETNDDYALSVRIADGYPYVEFFNYFLSRFLIVIQSHVNEMNVYVIFMIFISFLSFFYFTKIILDTGRKNPVHIMLLAALIVFSFDHYCAIQFTKTGALVMMTGFVALTDSVIKRKGLGDISWLLCSSISVLRYASKPYLLRSACRWSQ